MLSILSKDGSFRTTYSKYHLSVILWHRFWTIFYIAYVFSYLFVPSCPARTHVQLSDQSRAVPAQWEWPVQWTTLSIRLHLSAPTGRALSHVSLWRSVHAVKQPDGHREHLRAGSASSFQRCRVGQEHPILSRPTAHGSGKISRDQQALVIRINQITSWLQWCKKHFSCNVILKIHLI